MRPLEVTLRKTRGYCQQASVGLSVQEIRPFLSVLVNDCVPTELGKRADTLPLSPELFAGLAGEMRTTDLPGASGRGFCNAGTGRAGQIDLALHIVRRDW
jgi:hypothetical protein